MSNEKIEKTHWLQSSNKNYLGHYDLPNGEPVILTIASAQLEIVENPKLKTTNEEKVIRFAETFDWVKPWIVNAVNAQTIIKTLGEKFMEDSIGKKIKLYVTQTKVKGEEVDCIRVKNMAQHLLADDKISPQEVVVLIGCGDEEGLIQKAGLKIIDWCKSVKINSVADLPKVKFEGYCKRLSQIIADKCK